MRPAAIFNRILPFITAILVIMIVALLVFAIYFTSGKEWITFLSGILIASVIESLGEAVALMRKADVPAHRFLEILTESLFAAPVYKTYGQLILDEKYQPAGFRMPLALKDIRSVLAAAEANVVPMPVASLIHDRLMTQVARGNDDLDWSALARLAAEDAGLELPRFRTAPAADSGSEHG